MKKTRETRPDGSHVISCSSKSCQSLPPHQCVKGGEIKHKVQCPRIKEQRRVFKEKKEEEAKEEIEVLK